MNNISELKISSKTFYSIYPLKQKLYFPISKTEQKWASNFNEFRYNQYLLARGCSRNLIGKLFNIDPLDVPLYAPPGKPPILKNGFGFLSISHCINCILIGWSNNEIGIDIECIDRMINTEKFIDRFLLKEEKFFLEKHSKENLDHKAIQIWVSKEAAIKWQKGNLFSELKKWEVDKSLKWAFHNDSKRGVKIYNYKFKEWTYSIACNALLKPILIE